jgi:hypothetical protein
MSPYIWSKVCSLSAITFGEAEAMVVCLGRKNQSKQQNYAKQSQFPEHQK